METQRNPIEMIKEKNRQRLRANFMQTNSKMGVADMHELAKREAYLANEPFHDSYFEALSLIYEKQELFENLLLSTEPRRWMKLLDTAGQWAFIVAIILFLVLGCSSSTPL